MVLRVYKENWNLGPIVPFNWGPDVAEAAPNQINVGHKSIDAAIKYIINEYDPFEKHIIKNLDYINDSLGISIVRESSSGSMTFSPRRRFHGFLEKFISESSHQGLEHQGGKYTIRVVRENWNGGDLVPMNWGNDVYQRSESRFEVGDQSAAELVRQLVELANL